MDEKILIVDDDLDTLRLVGLLLKRKGYHVSAADNGQQAVEKAAVEHPDLILLDVMMPEIDGMEVLRRLRAAPGTAEIPVILFTARSQVEDKVGGLNAGADDYLTKPTHPAELIARVRKILARSESRNVSSAAALPGRARGRVTALLAAKGGLGTTTTAVNVAISLRQKTGQDVVLVEMRPGLGTAALMLNLPENGGLSTLLSRQAEAIRESDLESALQHHPGGLYVLPASHNPVDVRLASAEAQLTAIVERLSHMFEHVLIDLGPGLSPGNLRVIEQCDRVLVLLEPVMPTVLQTRSLLEELRMKVLGLGAIQLVLVSRVRLESSIAPGDIQSDLGHKLAAVIPAVPELSYRALSEGTPITELQPENIISQQYAKVAELVNS